MPPSPLPVPIDDSVDVAEFTSAISSGAYRLQALIVHELTTRPEQYTEVLSESQVPDPALTAMRELVENIEHGRDMAASLPRIAKLIHNQDSRAEVFNSLSLTHDYGRYANFLQARRRIEVVLLAMANSAKLHPGDALALLTYLEEQIKAIEKKISSNSTSGKDLAGLLSKIDYVMSTQQQELARRMAKTTPVNREIIRRVAHKMLKLSASERGSQEHAP